MDGSEVTVIVLGQTGVGSTTFIAHSLDLAPNAVTSTQQTTLKICGRDIRIKIVDNPSRHELVPATLVIMLFDLTNKETFERLHGTLEQAQRVSPTALWAVVGTKADLRDQREVATKEAVAFCQSCHLGTSPTPYYETAIEPTECIFIAFQEIVARPLINEYVIRATTEQELITFVHEMMEWAIMNNSANILTHLRDLGYAVPPELIDRYQETMREYLFAEYPLQVVPRFSHVKSEEHVVDEFDDYSLEEYDEPLVVIDRRPTLQVTRMYHLMWKDISLTSFKRVFLDPNSIPVYNIAHIDLSYNYLTSVPVQFFQIPNLESLNISHNQITQLPGIELWNTRTKLQILNASHNQITGDNHSPLQYRKHGGRVRTPFPEFWHLDLSHNDFRTFPHWVLHFPFLKHLNIQNNPRIHTLPRELCSMRHLMTLLLDGLVFTDPPPLTTKWGSQFLLHYLSLKQRAVVPWSSLRVVMVGPKAVGKTTLLAKLRGEGAITTTPTKGLEVTEWKYRVNDLFFRNKWCTFDFWDFSGAPEYHCIYSCFDCANSLHIIVCDARQERKELVRWLSDIQSTSVRRIPVIVVFTHMDAFKSREQKEEFKRRTVQWLEIHNKRFDSTNGAFSLMSSMSQSVRTLQGEDMLSSYEPPVEAFDMQEACGDPIPLVPLIMKVHFVNNATGEGVQNVKKTLYKLACGSLQQDILDFPGFQMIGQEVPAMYTNVELLVRQLRNKFRSSRREGEQKPFYTIAELMDKLRRPLKELGVGVKDFMGPLKLMHELGFICLYESNKGSTPTTMVGIDPQLVGYLLQRMIRAGLVTQEVNSHNCYLPDSHLVMLWGVEPIWSINQDTKTVYSHHLLDYLHHLNICTPLLPGVTLIPSILPPTLPEGCNPDSSLLTPRRVYILGYLPTLFYSQLTSRIISSLVTNDGPLPPTSPNRPPPPVSIPLTTATGTKLYLWQRNIFLEDVNGSKLWLRVSEGKQAGPESLPYCGRIDVSVQAELEKEAAWLRLVTQEIDFLLEHVYPTLLDAEQTPQQVEIFVPLGEEWATSTFGSDDSLSLPREARTEPIQISTPQSPGNPTGLLSPGIELHQQNGLQTSPPQQQPNGALSTSQKPSPVVDLLSPQSTSTPQPHRLSEQQEASSWEVLHHSSSTSTRLSMIQDSSSSYFLVPLWECLQEAFKIPIIRVHGNRLSLRDVIPDLLFADLPPESIFRNTVGTNDHFLMSLEADFAGEGPPSRDVSGLFVRPYYTSEVTDICARKPAGAMKTFCLKQCLAHAREDLIRLRQLQCPYLVAAISVSFCPPSLALESAPLGSLRSILRRKWEAIGRDTIHQIALQILNALEFFHSKGLNYHTLNSDNILLWTLDPVSIKLSDCGITHKPSSCELCTYVNSIPDNSRRWALGCKVDFMLLGLLMYELATGKRPYENVYKLGMVVQALLNNKLQLSVEAELLNQREQRKERGEEGVSITGCQRLCLQSSLDQCIYTDPVPVCELGARFSLCAGDHQWSPMRLLVNVECMLCNEHADLVYWASGSRGLVTGTLEPSTGALISNVLQEAPLPASGLFANRRGKPVPIAVGRATVLALVLATKQLWVGTENGLMGSAYVFNLPDMRRHHYIHLQDAVLSLCAINDCGTVFGGEEMKYRVLVGLANGTIILFLGFHGGKVLENPLQGPKLVVVTHKRKPCLSINLTPDGHIWCGCGNTVEVFDITSLRSIRKLATAPVATPPTGAISAETAAAEEERGQRTASRGDVITLMAVSQRGVWIVSRRSPVLRLWNQVSGQLKASFNVRNVLHGDQDDITALAIQGGAVWLGTRSGYVFVLDAAMMDAAGEPLMGLQYCGEGKVKSIVPLTPWKGVTPRLQVVCSLECPDEVSGALLSWEYHHRQPWQHRTGFGRSFSVPPTPTLPSSTSPPPAPTLLTPPIPTPSLLTPPIPIPTPKHSEPIVQCKSF